ncbi:MATE family efflux transporter [Lacrimispora celerecrescens]|uniref:Putative MATE family efflux protein n=1 Tax=[Clostridium] celerecrescens 18A TaxID=1286362 RepID=A0A2M8Z214_9FIRM|nr:MATE family efflux transporter [Lacrimispora celerecrescens]PJJ27473.1 putative MATE family efflux protein [[Clostridium] celerecrescens 18A]
MKKKQSTNQIIMTEGEIWKQLLAFSVPLLAGNLFQQLYNTVDSVVVGNFIGSDALAAVGSSNSLINLIIGMFMGIGTGAGVIISQYYGARDEMKLHWAVHTSMALSLMGGLILIVLGVLMSPFILSWMGTPEKVMPSSVAYLRIFFCGSLFNIVYNMGAGILRAVGDSKRPLYYLCVSSVINIVLDLVFVVVFGMGTAGVGYATVIAQAVSSVLVVWALVKTEDIYQLVPGKIRIDRRMMVRILKLGIPSGIQQSIISLSNVIVQANVNSFGSAAMAGFGAYSKIDGFAMLPLQSFCMAATTFTGQNIGAKKPKRVKQGVFQGIAISMAYTAFISVILYLNAEHILKIFSTDEDVIAYGYSTMLVLLPFYWTIAIHQILMGSIRGSGRTMVSMLIGVGNMCILRMIYINLLVPFFPSFGAVMWCYPITWITTMLMDCVYSIKAKWIPNGSNE